jgi:hypothetical protein
MQGASKVIREHLNRQLQEEMIRLPLYDHANINQIGETRHFSSTPTSQAHMCCSMQADPQIQLSQKEYMPKRDGTVSPLTLV